MSDIGYIKLKGKIWKKEIFDLIDYDSIDFEISDITISETGMIYRINNQISFTNQINKILKTFKLIEILKTEKDYFIITEQSKCDLKLLSKEKVGFFVYKGMSFKEYNSNTKKRWYKLNEGDIFKLGRVYIKVIKIKLEDENIDKTSDRILSKRNFSSNSLIEEQNIIRGNFTNRNRKITIFNNDISNEIKSVRLPKISSYKNIFKLDIDKYSNNNSEKKIKKIKKNINTCRICYNNEESIENPLINPCKCSGSMEYIHYKCLRNWLFSKIDNKDSDITISYNLSKFQCELCKENFPDYIKYNNKLYNLFLYEPKFNHYIIIETVRDDKFKTRFIHIISYDNKNTISFGRSSDCEFSIPELSISRNHCLIHKMNLNLFLEDNFSKFGTLVLIQNPKLRIIENLPLRIQIGKTYLKLLFNKKSSFFSCCNCNINDEINLSYQRQNLNFLNIYKNANIKNIKIYENDDEENEKEYEIKKIKILKNENSKSSLPLLSIDNSKLIKRTKPINLRTVSIRNTNTTGIISLYNNDNHRNNINNNNSGNIIRLRINRFNNNNNQENIPEATYSVLNNEQ